MQKPRCALLALLLLLWSRLAYGSQELLPFTLAISANTPRHSHLECTAGLDWRTRRCLVRSLAFIRANPDHSHQVQTPEWFLGAEAGANVPQPLVPKWYGEPLYVGMLPGAAPAFCTPENSIYTPVVLAARDEPSPWHLLVMQLLPIFSALRDIGAEDERFQVVLLDAGRDHTYQARRVLCTFRPPMDFTASLSAWVETLV